MKSRQRRGKSKPTKNTDKFTLAIRFVRLDYGFLKKSKNPALPVGFEPIKGAKNWF